MTKVVRCLLVVRMARHEEGLRKAKERKTKKINSRIMGEVVRD